MRMVQRAVFQGGYRKYLFESKGDRFEASLHPCEGGVSIHVSTQVGCGMGCTFCATSRLGHVRDLAAGEIAAQVELVSREAGVRPGVVSASAQGEPLENLDALLGAFSLIRERFGNVRFEVSTCGCVEGIGRLAREYTGCALTVTLHSVKQDARDRLMPGAHRWPLDVLRAGLRAHADAFSRMAIDVALIPGTNDTLGDARALAAWCEGLPCMVRVMPMSPIASGCAPVGQAGMHRFAKSLREQGLEVEELPALPSNPMSMKTFPAERRVDNFF